ncbi:hypothetical protein [Paraburkholderia youngii]|uniref:hypothetical protein n=1 Tax=Paraburkholderia youngii TaxID=2782701 RepID=UPI003D193D44
MKKGLLVVLFAVGLYNAHASAAQGFPAKGGSANPGDPFCKGAVAVSVLEREPGGAVTSPFIGSLNTTGAPVTFSDEFSESVARSSLNDDQIGYLNLTVRNIAPGPDDSVAFDVVIEGKDPGAYDGRVVVHALTPSGSREAVVHWVNGRDYVIAVRPVAG